MTAPVLSVWTALGGDSGVLGSPTSGQVTGQLGGGLYQNFTGGAVSWTAATGAHATYGAIRAVWRDTRYEFGPLGYPTSEVTSGLPGGGSSQQFQGGTIVSSSRGTFPITSSMSTVWTSLKGPDGVLGYPTGVVAGIRDGGSYQSFEGGAVISSARGTFATYGATRAVWGANRYEEGILGYPAGSVVALRDSGSAQAYEGGFAVSSRFGGFVVPGYVAVAWGNAGWETGVLGYPTGVVTGIRDGGSYQSFEGGAVISSARGTFATYGGTRAVWGANRYEEGILGYPAGSVVALRDSGSAQAYEGGFAVSSRFGGFVVPGYVAVAWGNAGWETGVLGYPTGVVTGIRDGGSYQSFEGGAVISSARGTFATYGATRAAWAANQYEEGFLGYPTGDPVRDSATTVHQDFEGGRVTVTNGIATVAALAWYSNHSGVSGGDVWASYRAGCPVAPSQLVRLTFPYWNMSGRISEGNVIVAANEADDVEATFAAAYAARFPFRQITPVEAYGGSDVASMNAGNTSAFNCRTVTGNPRSLSQHSYGNAIDYNTFENPYVTASQVYPAGAASFLDRSNRRPGMIFAGDAIAGTMAARGWLWGARWSYPDYQHFSSNGG